MKLLQIHEPGQTPLPHEDTAAVGIDLGTTHSVVAIASDTGAEVIHNIHGHALVPSVVYYAPDGNVEVGYPAKLRYDRGEKGTVASVKRLMGRGAADIKSLMGNLPYDIVPADGMVKIKAGGREVTPVEVSAEILRTLRANAERALGRSVTRAVITVPAYFDDAARTATRDAAKLAGLEVLRLVNEPTAAALAYGLDTGAQGVYAVYDLGGGTFDVSLLKLEQGVFQVLATGGDTALGGDDFDQAIAAWLLTELALGDAALDPGQVGALVALAREAKHVLTEKESVTLQIPPPVGGRLGGGQICSVIQNCSHPQVKPGASSNPPPMGEGITTLTRDIFDGLIYPYVEKTIEVCRQALLDAKLSTADIKGVVMVGGSTRVPLVYSEVHNFFEKTPLTDVNPDEVVAVGAALQAHGLTAGSDNLLLDVIPLSLGLETMGGLTEKIIYRNTPIPVAVAQEFTTYQDGQTGMQIHVVQGEREMVQHNRSLARFELTGIPPMPAGIARIKVTFTVDADGLLTVSAEEGTTGVQQTVRVKPSYGLAPEEIEKMLMDSMENARKDIGERLLAEARVEAEGAIMGLQSAMAQDAALMTPEEKTRFERQITTLRNAIEGEDRDYIDAETQELGRLSQAFAERRMDTAIGKMLSGKRVDSIS